MMLALDLFAGTGWGVACQRLGIEERGVENMPEARASRVAAGMPTASWADVWDLLAAAPTSSPEFRAALLIASPPCQTFSAAGGGAGRRALSEVFMLMSAAVTLDGDRLRQRAADAGLDDRTALVLTPLVYIHRHRPAYVALEQVPSVLPVWEQYAYVMRSWGYSVATGILHAEQYGVPQTRRRAFLVARSDGFEARLPEPTHSRFHPRKPSLIDPGMPRWVTMAEALGWSDPTRALFTSQSSHGDYENRAGRRGDQPAPTITANANRAMWCFERPATTVQGDSRLWPPGHKVNADDMRRLGEGEARARYGDRAGTEAIRLTLEEAAVLQSYPANFPFQGSKSKRFLQVGNAVPPLLAEQVLKTITSQEPVSGAG